jgi:Brp/Blh family beta-carotene 15,15'-monooxygenase
LSVPEGEAMPQNRIGSPTSLAQQGLAFSALAWLTVLACLWLPPLSAQAQLVMLSPVILVLGVPHGALDVLYAGQLGGIRSLRGWSLFTIAYFAVAASVLLLWWLAPGTFLVAFLLISAFHFSGDPAGETPALLSVPRPAEADRPPWGSSKVAKPHLLERTLYGGAVILCPLALHATEVLQLFAFLVGLPAAQAIVDVLHVAAWPWVAAIGVAAILGLRTAWVRSIELVSLAALLTFSPPLIGFTLFFCGMHSARHVLRTRDYSRAETLHQLLRIVCWPMLATVVGVAIAVACSGDKPLDLRLAQVLFVGLAALTVPHMMVVERVRLAGWVKG